MKKSKDSRLINQVDERDHILGPPDAPVVLLEYGDYQCPYCGQAHQILKELLPRLGNRVCYVFRHFPLTTMHPYAEHAAEAAEAAGAQGKFWEMHDILFENQDALDDESLVEYAGVLGLDLQRFVKDLKTHKYHSKVREDFAGGVRSGVNGTPTFFLNNARLDGLQDLYALETAIEDAA